MIRKAKWAPEVRFTLLCVLLICQRILFTNSVHYFKGWVEKHITINSMISFTVDTLIILDKLVPRALFSGFGVGAPLKAREKPPGDDVEFWKDFFLWQSSDCYVTLVSTKRECGRHLIRSSWDSHGRDIGQLSYIIAQQGSSQEMLSLWLQLYNNGVYYNYFFQEVKQLQNEIYKLSWLRHPRIVRFHGSEQKGDVIYLFLDFMAGVRVF